MRDGHAQTLPSGIEPKPVAGLPGTGLDDHRDVQDGDLVERDAAELDRRAVAVVLVVEGHVADA